MTSLFDRRAYSTGAEWSFDLTSMGAACIKRQFGPFGSNVKRSNAFEGLTSLTQSDFAGREIIDPSFYLQFAISNRIADDG